MPNDLNFPVVGNLTADPELRFTQSGIAVAAFTIAFTPRRFNPQSSEWEDREPLFVRCSAWRDLGEHVAESLHKGDRVIANGPLRANRYTDKDGNEQVGWQLDVDEIGPSLKYATAKPSKVQGGNRPPHPADQYGTSAPTGYGQGGQGYAPQGQPQGDPWQGQQGGYDAPPF